MVSLKPAYEMGLSILRVLSNAITGIVLVGCWKEIAHLNDAELQSLSYGIKLIGLWPCKVEASVIKVMKLREYSFRKSSL